MLYVELLRETSPPSRPRKICRTMKLSSLSASVVLALGFFAPALATTYSLTDNIVGSGFYNAFEWEAIADPTNGRV